MPSNWPKTVLASGKHAEDTLARLAGLRWLFRGQEQLYGNLSPSIDRLKPRRPRLAKLTLERQSIDLFRVTASFVGPGEEAAYRDDGVALAILRHYRVPTRILDWTLSPHVAAYFAVCGSDETDGELWGFDHDRYAECGMAQWKRHRDATLSGDGKTFVAGLTAFSEATPYDWFCCMFYPRGFPRQDRQQGLYSLTRCFEVDHQTAIARLLGSRRFYRRYIIKANIKPDLRRVLREKHGIWRGSLFPDSAGAADTVLRDVFGLE